MKLRRNVGLLVLAMVAQLTLVGATYPLQPLVEVKKSRPAALTPGCDESLAPAPTPRVDVKQIPAPQVVPVSIPAPPSGSLRSELEAAHRALAGNDRPAFDEHLRNARAILSGYPSGGERNAAEEVVRVLDDAARVWDAQFQSPFFDERSDAYTRASRYPGYADAVRRNMLVDDQDRRYYPAAESRDFLTRIAADRLPRVGVRPQTRIARDERPSMPSVNTRPPVTRRTGTTPSVDDAPSTPRQTARATQQTARATPQTTTRRATRRRSYSPSRSASRSTPRAGSRSRSSRPATATPAPSSPDRSVAAAPADPAPAVAAAPVPSSTVASAPPDADVPASDTVPTDTYVATTGTAPEPTDTTGTAVTPSATTTSAPEIPSTPGPERRSVVVPALLILIGLGVLVLLFRAAK